FMGLSSLPSAVDTLVSFIVWLDLVHSFSSCADTLVAVSREHLERQLPDPSKEYRVKRVYKALLKEHRKDRGIMCLDNFSVIFLLNEFWNL
ncbi:18241_t:CDS:2, partial [Dentiscutata erythropus]